jgi:hypothetical protein
MLGSAAVAMWWDVDPGMRAEWEDWHTAEHMPERLALPGFLRGTRWVAESGEPSYFVLYETAGLDTITSGPYLERLNHPSPWSRKMMPHHRNMVRSLCTVRAGWGGGLTQALATVRLSTLDNDLKIELPRAKGLSSAHLLVSQPLPAQTAEQKIRGGDGTIAGALLVGGYSLEAVKAAAGATAGIYRVSCSLVAGELA